MTHFDVIVVGAGAAGLAAAHALSGHGMTVAIIEARDRIGGRICTSRRYGTIPAELGAEFVHGRPAVSFSIAHAAGLTLCELAGEDWISQGGRFHLAHDQDKGLSSFSRALSRWTQEDVSAQALMDTRFSGNRWEAARRWATKYVEDFDAAPLDDVSVRWLARDEAADAAIEGDRQFRVMEGYDRLLEWLRENPQSLKTHLYLRAAVHEIHWTRGNVEVSARSPLGAAMEPITARMAVLTVPVGVLAAPPDEPGGIRFVPDLPEKRDALAGPSMGHVVKVLFYFREPFWDSGVRTRPSLPQLSFLFADDDVISTWWTNAPLLTPTLTGWVGGPRAKQLASRADASIVEQAKDALARVFHLKTRRLAELLIGVDFHNWSADPFSRGAYSYTRVGGLEAQRSLAEPIAGTLFFAGEATHYAGHSATVHGALETGQRAASEIVSQLSS